jgi:hypothetical protein
MHLLRKIIPQTTPRLPVKTAMAHTQHLQPRRKTLQKTVTQTTTMRTQHPLYMIHMRPTPTTMLRLTKHRTLPVRQSIAIHR